jgi:CelD/BcsL family acetyltransferase involved in cellulose biosynthesis
VARGLTNIEVIEVNDWGALAPLAGEWNTLLTESPSDTLFLRHEWLGLWWRHFGAGRRLAFFLARRAGRLVAALPLMEQRDRVAGLAITTLRSPTNGHSFRYNALCARGEERAMETIWFALRSRSGAWDRLVLQEVPEDALVLEPMLAAARSDGALTGAWRGPDVPYLPTDGTWEAYRASLSRNMRANLRKKHRRLTEEGDVTYRCVSARAEVAEALRAGFALEGSGWKDRAGSTIQSDPTLKSFYSQWADLAAARGWLRLSFLDVKGTPVAFDFSTLYAGRYYDLKMGYDPAWERFSVGQLLKEEILKRCFESETREYDFLGESMRAKDDWMPLKRTHFWHFVYPGSMRGRALHFLKFRAAPALKRLAGRGPRPETRP